MILDEPGHEAGVEFRQSMLDAEAQGIDFAQRRMIAAAAFRDVMEQSGKVEKLGPLEIAHQAACKRKLMRELRHREAPQIAHDVEDVLVDGVDVIQIVLHLADDAPECWNVAPE